MGLETIIGVLVLVLGFLGLFYTSEPFRTRVTVLTTYALAHLWYWKTTDSQQYVIRRHVK